MSWQRHYHSPDLKYWQGRPDTPAASCFFQIINLLNLLQPIPVNTDELTFALIGFRCDEGIRRNLGRTGAVDGPIALREALAKLPIPPKEHFTCYDAGDIICVDKDLESAQQALGHSVAILLQHRMIPLVIGGGHELAWGHFQGIASQFPYEDLGIVNFDAHFDMRPLLPHNQGSSGTPFLQIAQAHQHAKRRFDYHCIGIQHAGNIRHLFATAENYHTKILAADELHQNPLQKNTPFVDRIINDNQIIYVSLCLDVFATAYAPGVSAPQSLGLTPWHVIPLMRQLAASGKVVSYDIAELSPQYDADQRTAKLAAHFIYEIMHHHTNPSGKNNDHHSTT